MNMIEILTPSDVMQTLQISKGTELAWRDAGILPPVIQLGRRIYYRKADIIQILQPKQPPQSNGIDK